MRIFPHLRDIAYDHNETTPIMRQCEESKQVVILLHDRSQYGFN